MARLNVYLPDELADALYVELAVARGLPLVTTDRRLHPVPLADVVRA